MLIPHVGYFFFFTIDAAIVLHSAGVSSIFRVTERWEMERCVALASCYGDSRFPRPVLDLLRTCVLFSFYSTRWFRNTAFIIAIIAYVSAVPIAINRCHSPSHFCWGRNMGGFVSLFWFESFIHVPSHVQASGVDSHHQTHSL